MFGLFGGIWSKVVMVFVGLAGVIATLFGWSRSIRKGARQEIESEQQRNTLERLRIKDEVERDIDSRPGDIRERLREQGYLRD